MGLLRRSLAEGSIWDHQGVRPAHWNSVDGANRWWAGQRRRRILSSGAERCVLGRRSGACHNHGGDARGGIECPFVLPDAKDYPPCACEQLLLVPVACNVEFELL